MTCLKLTDSHQLNTIIGKMFQHSSFVSQMLFLRPIQLRSTSPDIPILVVHCPRSQIYCFNDSLLKSSLWRCSSYSLVTLLDSPPGICKCIVQNALIFPSSTTMTWQAFTRSPCSGWHTVQCTIPMLCETAI